MNLADRLRSYGLTVVERAGWETRTNKNRDRLATYGILNHFDANVGTPRIEHYLYDNRFSGLLYHILIRRDGTVHLLGQRYAYHAGDGDARVRADMAANVPPRQGTREDAHGNPYFFAISINHHPDFELAIPTAQFDALVKANAAVADHYGLGKNQIADHATWTDRKRDIKRIDWPVFREAVAMARQSQGGEDMQLPAERRDDVMALLAKGVIQGTITHYFPVAGQPSADLPVEAWVNLNLAAIGGAARLGLLDGGSGPSASQIRKIIADAINNG